MLKICVSIVHTDVDQKFCRLGFLKKKFDVCIFLLYELSMLKKIKMLHILLHILRKEDIRVGTLLLSECYVPWIHRNNLAINTVVLEGFFLINMWT